MGNDAEDFVVAVCVLQLNDVLHQVVAERVFDEVLQMVNNRVGQRQFLSDKSFFQAALHDAAPVLVSAYLVAKVNARLENEVCELCKARRAWFVLVLGVLGSSEVHQKCLKHVVTVRIGSHLKHFRRQMLNHAFDLRFEFVVVFP